MTHAGRWKHCAFGESLLRFKERIRPTEFLKFQVSDLQELSYGAGHDWTRWHVVKDLAGATWLAFARTHLTSSDSKPFYISLATWKAVKLTSLSTAAVRRPTACSGTMTNAYTRPPVRFWEDQRDFMNKYVRQLFEFNILSFCLKKSVPLI